MLGRHINHRQRLWIIAIPAILAAVLIAWIVWPSGSHQTPARGTYNAPRADVTTTTTNGATTTTVLAPKIPKSAGSGVISGISSTAPVGIPTTTAPTPVGSPTGDTGNTGTAPPAATTTTAPPGATVDYVAYVSPTFTQNATNPLEVTYGYSAGASTVVNGVSLELANLPSGTLALSANGTQQCAMAVGGVVAGGTCSVTYAAFGGESMVATYNVSETGYSSDPAVDDVEPFATTTVAGISGGGSEGGLVFQADVTDGNGHAVTTGAVSMTIADTTQGWSYVVSGAPGGSGTTDSDAFTCILIENYPSVGEYNGCSFGGLIFVTPASGDVLTETAAFAGTTDWAGSTSAEISYTMP